MEINGTGATTVAPFSGHAMWHKGKPTTVGAIGVGSNPPTVLWLKDAPELLTSTGGGYAAQKGNGKGHSAS